MASFEEKLDKFCFETLLDSKNYRVDNRMRLNLRKIQSNLAFSVPRIDREFNLCEPKSKDFRVRLAPRNHLKFDSEEYPSSSFLLQSGSEMKEESLEIGTPALYFKKAKTKNAKNPIRVFRNQTSVRTPKLGSNKNVSNHQQSFKSIDSQESLDPNYNPQVKEYQLISKKSIGLSNFHQGLKPHLNSFIMDMNQTSLMRDDVELERTMNKTILEERGEKSDLELKPTSKPLLPVKNNPQPEFRLKRAAVVSIQNPQFQTKPVRALSKFLNQVAVMHRNRPTAKKEKKRLQLEEHTSIESPQVSSKQRDTPPTTQNTSTLNIRRLDLSAIKSSSRDSINKLKKDVEDFKAYMKSPAVKNRAPSFSGFLLQKKIPHRTEGLLPG